MGIFRRTALKFVIFPGVVSLFANMTYEGADSLPAGWWFFPQSMSAFKEE